MQLNPIASAIKSLIDNWN